nr:hypothetical protein [Arthrobacter sp. J3.40]
MDHSSPKAPFWERHPNLTAGVVAVVAAVLSGVIGFLGATVGANASLEAATIQNEAENVRRAQDHRDVVYKNYLEAADKYFSAWAAWSDTRSSSEEFDNLIAARSDFRAQINEVYVHGSPRAWNASEMVAAYLPVASAESLLPERDEYLPRNEFAKAYSDFLSIRCQEVTSGPPGDCRDRNPTRR